ncbi:MAG: transposase [Saprospiraceae bacterium]|nr:transposase [Candidatus Vicinibacter proximus]
MTYTIYRNIYYSTFTIYQWKKLLKNEKYIELVLDCLVFLYKNNRCLIFAFVIMPDHIHLIYEVLEPNSNENFKHNFLSYTAHQFSKKMSSEMKEEFLVNKSKRKYQFWKSPSLSVEIVSPKFLIQKFNYLHDNPRRAGLVEDNLNYKYCSYSSYELGAPQFDFLTLFL